MEAAKGFDQLIWDSTHRTPAIDWLAFEHPHQLFYRENPLDEALCTSHCSNELFRRDPRDPENPGKPLSTESFRALPEHIRASIAWHRLILCRSPLGETPRQLLTALGLCGMDISNHFLSELRLKLAETTAEEFTKQCFSLANLSAAGVRINMLQADDKSAEIPANCGKTGILPVLGFEEIFENWEASCAALKDAGLPIKKNVDKPSSGILLEHLSNLVSRKGFAAMSARLIPSFNTSSRKSPAYKIIQRCLLPISTVTGIPLILRVGHVPQTGALADSYTDCDLEWLPQMLQEFPQAKIILAACTPAQAEASCRLGRTYPKLTTAATGNMSSSETDKLFHSILEHNGTEALPYLSCSNSPLMLVGRWAHLRWNTGKLLQQSYANLLRTGWVTGKDELAADMQILFNNCGEPPQRPSQD